MRKAKEDGKRGEKIGEKFQDRQHKKREAQEMAKPSSDALPESFQKILSPTATIFEGVSPETVHKVLSFFSTVSISAVLPDHSTTKDFYSELIAGLLKPLRIEPGRVTCLLTVKPPIINTFSTVHGGAVAAIAEVMSIACARTVVAEGKEVFLGEQSISYLSAVQNNAELIVDAHVVRKGRNLTVVAIDFTSKKTQQMIYQARSTFYNTPLAKL